MLDDGLPSGRDEELELPEKEEPAPANSLSEDIAALIEDGKTYAEAEIAFQKTRLSFTADRAKWGTLYILIALSVLHLALVAIVVGGILALTPLITAWGATAVVVGLLVLVGVIFGVKAKNRFGGLSKAFEQTKSDEETNA